MDGVAPGADEGVAVGPVGGRSVAARKARPSARSDRAATRRGAQRVRNSTNGCLIVQTSSFVA